MKGSVSKLAISKHLPVEKGALFELNKRRGTVVETRIDTCIVLWEEAVDPKSGEVLPAIAGSVANEDFCRFDLHGRLRVLHRPSAAVAEGQRGVIVRTKAEIARMKFRYCFVSAAQQLLIDGEIEENRAGFVSAEHAIIGLGTRHYTEYLLKEAGATGRRGGAKVDLGAHSSAPKSAANIFKWYCKHRQGGENALFDDYINCGNRENRYSDAEQALVRSVIDRRLDEERCSIASIVSSVQAVFDVHNEKAAQLNPPGEFYNRPGYEYIRDLIDEMAPMDHAIRTRGLKVAYRDMHALGVGIKTTRALERVEIDEYTFDLMVILRASKIWDWLRPEEREMLGLDGSARRVVISAAICVHTRCMVGMQASASSMTSLFRETLEMVFMDKTPVADALGAHDPWNQGGRPEGVCLDRGPNYIADAVYEMLASLGITNFGAPARKPWLRPFIERLFKTIHLTFAQRFTGRTFSDVVKKGENNAEERASLTLDDFLQWLVRWTVDIYHNEKHSGLQGLTPAEAWALSQAQSRLQSVSREEMRLVFGIRRHRKLGPSGIRMMHINYQTDELADLYLAPPNKPKVLEVAWWPHDIGTISVKIGPSEWLNVTAADPMWIGKSLEDLMMLRHRLGGERDRSDAVKARALVEMDDAAYRVKAARGLLPTVVTDETYDRYEAEFKRFMWTAEREFDAAEHTDLFDSVIDLTPVVDDAVSEPPRAMSHQSHKPTTNTSVEDEDDLME